jgi:hemin uptake protein HemP
VHDETRRRSTLGKIAAQPPRPQAPSRTTSQALLGAARELVIEHDGREYRLRITQQGKLILTA